MMPPRPNPGIWRRLTFWAFVFFIAAWLAPELWARLGGGGGYSGGGGGGGGSTSGGGGDGDFIIFFIWLCIEYPYIGLPVVGLFIIIGIFGKSKEQDSLVVMPEPVPPPDWDALRAHDENFSEVLFRDFGYSLFSKIHEARGSGQLVRFNQYIDDDVRVDLESMHADLTDVFGVVVGGMTVPNLRVPADPKEIVSVRLMYVANYTEVSANGEQAIYSNQAWFLSRRAGALSPEPDRISALGCVGCGSPLEPQPDGTCPHCGNQYARGEHHWYVTSVVELDRRVVGPALTTKAADVGLELDTVYDTDLEARRLQLLAAHRGLDFQVVENRFRHVFSNLQKAWSEQDLDALRPFETDSLYQNHKYWIEEYRRQNLRNILKNVVVHDLAVVKLRSDKFYDAITCRLWASMIDYTEDAQGKRVCGDKKKRARFSEYWTFVRGRGAAENTKGDAVCPNCAAELNVTMAGECEYCGSKLTSGEFDWVLSEIQQDEEYAG